MMSRTALWNNDQFLCYYYYVVEQVFSRIFSTAVAVGRISNSELQLVAPSVALLLICIELNSAQL